MQLFLPKAVKKAISVLENAGYEAFCVGGAVRDLLMGRDTPSDFDVTTNCPPDETARLFPHNIPTGIKHGTVTVICDDMAIEVTTYRTEGGYSDARHPDKVQFVGSIREDLARRDFTVNAIAYNEKSGIYDPFCGIDDIKARTLRAVGEPKKRFCEDALRILRLYRFASQLGFLPEDLTEAGAQATLPLLEKISAERILNEISRLLCGEYIELSAPLFKSGGLEFLGLKKLDVSALSSLPRELDTRFAAALYLSASDSKEVMNNLKADNKLKSNVSTIISLLKTDAPKTRADIKRALCLAGAECFFKYLSILALSSATCADKIKAEATDVLEKGEPYKISHLAVSGDDLLKLGFKGTAVGKELSRLLTLVQENPSLNTKEKLITK